MTKYGQENPPTKSYGDDDESCLILIRIKKQFLKVKVAKS